jgi:uncharacterized protein (DUF58 family)
MPIQHKYFSGTSSLEFTTKKIVEGALTGIHKSPFHGFSVEFLEHRQFQNGDETKNIDWKLFAKTGEHYIKKFEEETNLNLQLVLDTSSSMYFPSTSPPFQPSDNKMAYAIYLAGCFIHIARKQRDAVGLHLFSNDLNISTPAKTNANHIHQLFELLGKHLDEIQENQTTGYLQALQSLVPRVNEKSVIIVITDFLPTLRPDEMKQLMATLQALKSKHSEILFFQIAEENLESQFNFPNRPVNIIDQETGKKFKLQPSEVKERYKEAYEKNLHQIKNNLLSQRILFERFTIDTPFVQALAPYLKRRSKMRY